MWVLLDHLSMKIVYARSCQSRIFILHCLAKLSWVENRIGMVQVRDSQECWVFCSLSLSLQTGPLTESGLRMAASRPAVLLSPPVGHKELQVLVFTAVHMGGDIWSQSSSWCCKDCHPGRFSLDVKLLFHSWHTPMLGTDDTAPLLCWFDYLVGFSHLCSYKRLAYN